MKKFLTPNTDTFELAEHQPWSAHAIDLAKKRFLNQDISIDEWYKRVIDFICQNYSDIDKIKYTDRYLHLLTEKKFFPTSAVLLNSISKKGALAGCMVVPLKDDIQSIFSSSLGEIMQLLLLGVGIGFDLSHFYPRLLPNGNAISLGPVETLRCLAHAVEKPAAYQGGKPAAFMATLFCQHPDIFEFIALKSRESIPNTNISVTFDEGFRYALRNDGLLPLVWTVNGLKRYLQIDDLAKMIESCDKRNVKKPDLFITNDKKIYSNSIQQIIGRTIGNTLFVDSHILLDVISHYAHICGDPGLLNLEAINSTNPTLSKYDSRDSLGIGSYTTTTPCGEQPLLDYEACYLGSLNLSAFVTQNNFDTLSYKNSIHDALRFLDDVISLSDLTLEKANLISLQNRKVGVGVMGFADALALLDIPYDSERALSFIDEIGSILQETCQLASENLAKERGAFPNFHDSVFCDKNPRRHATLTTIAPTGHIATLADCSFGIEPYYLLSFEREAAGKKIYSCTILEHKLKCLDYSLELWIKDTQKINSQFQFNGTLENLIENPFQDQKKNQRLNELKNIFRTSFEISADAHINIIKAWQKYIDNGISKTINLAKNSSQKDVRSIFEKFIDLNLKGISIFRDQSLEKQALRGHKSCEGC